MSDLADSIGLPPSEAQRLTRGQLLDLMLDIEERLRDLVRAVLSRGRNDWESLIPRKIRAALRRSRKREHRGAGSFWREDLLHYATLKQLIDLMTGTWEYFEPLLKERLRVEAWLEEFRQFRNSLAHGLKPTPDQKVEIIVVLNNVARRIPALPSGKDPGPTGAPRSARTSGRFALLERSVLWADDRPWLTRSERRWFEELGAHMVPVLSNDEALEASLDSSFDLVISDINRGEGEPGTFLPFRLRAAGQSVPLVFYSGDFDKALGIPEGAVGITNDPAALLQLALEVLHPL